MSTETLHSQEDFAARPPIAPVEQERAPGAVANDNERAVNDNAATPGKSLSPAQAKAPEVHATGIAGWLHRHRNFTKEPFTYTVYQLFRSSIAAIPYGVGMAGAHHVFGLFSAWGQKAGLTEKGIQTFTEAVGAKKGGLAAVELAAGAAKNIGEIYKPGMKAMLGRNLMRLGNSPLNPAIQIALGFTMFRFTGGVIKNLRDRVMNEKNTEADTALEVKSWFHTIKETFRINWPAESVGTPIAALVLGFMNSAYTPSPHGVPVRNKELYPGIGGFFKQGKEVLFNPKAKLLQNAAVWSLSYSLFFLLAESLFKDVQLQRGLWKGHPNSLKNGPDDTVGGPGAVNFKTPENDPAIHKSAEEGYKPDDRAKDSHQKLRFPFFTAEPSIGRFVLRRLIPVGLGITAYCGAKRLGYLKMGGPMQQMTVEALDTMKTFGEHLNFFGKNYAREAGATATFGVLWMATDAWGSMYDKIVHKLQNPHEAEPLSSHQQQNHTELLGQLNAKYQGQGRAA